jgi:ribosomal protein L19
MNAEQAIRSLEADYIKTDLPEIYVGDTIRVGVSIQEGGKERVQPYEGTVIAKRGGGINRGHHRSPCFPGRWRGAGVFSARASHCQH